MLQRFSAIASCFFIFLGLVFSAASAKAGDLVVQVNGIQSANGRVFVGVCDKGLSPRECSLGSSRPARPGRMEFRFENIKPARYAIAVYHDVNGNGALDRTAIGLPKEPYGFSNDVGRLTPPSFSGAAVSVGEGGATISINVRPF